MLLIRNMRHYFKILFTTFILWTVKISFNFDDRIVQASTKMSNLKNKRNEKQNNFLT